MRHNIRKTIAGLTFAVVASTAPVHAQVATFDSPLQVYVGTMQFTGQQTGQNKENVVYTVPAGRGFRVTDLVLSSYGISTCVVHLPGKTNPVIVAVDRTESFNFLSGPTYGPGQEIKVANIVGFNGEGTSCDLSFTVMGYLYRRR
jgi:hypothetical protein